MKHFKLRLFIAVAAAVAIVTASRLTAPTAPSIGAGELYHRASRGEVVIVDIRSSDEFQRDPIPGARNMSAEELAKACKEGVIWPAVVVVCDTGHESKNLVAKLVKEQAAQIAYLRGGIRAWRKVVGR